MPKWLPDLGRLRRAVLWATPGQLDAGFASLATFATGIVAVRALGTAGLAAYALLSSAYRVTNQFPSRIVFSPSEVIVVDSPISERLGALAHSVPRGAWISTASALAVPLGAIVVAGELSRSNLIALSITATLLAIISPLQDHVRTVFHMADSSWMAAAMSATNLVGTGISLLLLYSFVNWAVFGSLFIGNCLSMLVAWAFIWRRAPDKPPKPSWRHLWELGGWLLVSGLGKTGIRYALTALLGFFAGIAALGFVEAARVVAQPVRVFAQGILTQVGPRLIEAGSRASDSSAGRWMKRYLGLLGLVTVPYFALVASDWDVNPFAAFAPRAYEVTGLVAAIVVVVVATAYTDALRYQLLGARRQRSVALITFVTGLVELVAITTGTWVGAYAAPLAASIALTITVLWFDRGLRDAYRSVSSDRPAELG